LLGTTAFVPGLKFTHCQHIQSDVFYPPPIHVSRYLLLTCDSDMLL